VCEGGGGPGRSRGESGGVAVVGGGQVGGGLFRLVEEVCGVGREV